MKYNEIFRLKKMIEKAQIPFEFRELYDGYQVCYPEKNEKPVCSVIEHEWSYGHQKDLLEIMGLLTDEESEDDSVLGWLSAEEVFRRIEKHYKEVEK